MRGRSCLRPLRWLVLVLLCGLVTVPAAATAPALYRIDHVAADGDTVDLTNGAKVRLVQIDTPEVYFGTECYGPQASRSQSGSCRRVRRCASRWSLRAMTSTATAGCSGT